MAGTADELRKLAALKRSKKNWEEIQGWVADLKEHSENASSLLDSLESLRNALSDFESELDSTGDDNPLTENWTADAREGLERFRALLPGDDGDESVTVLIGELDEACEEYESSLDDREYSKEDRDEMFDTICNRLTDVADALTIKPPAEED